MFGSAANLRNVHRPKLATVASEPMMSDFLQNELAALDRQYSYEQTVQLGRYRLDADAPLSAQVKATDKKIHAEIEETKKSVRFHTFDPREVWKEEKRARTWGAQLKRWRAQFSPAMSWVTLKMVLVDWVYLAALGIGMALLSMLIDYLIEFMHTFQILIMTVSGRTGSTFFDYVCTYLSWVGYTELLVICSAMFVHYVAPQAIGSGIPEMKTILRGVVLKDYLTFRTLISKVIGLIFSLGSGIPIGKMGPMVHIASIFASQLSNIAANFDGAYGNECRKSEMLAAACAVGVACTFSAPVGGVLFSIEVTTMYFSVRNYWRGFFAAACGATVFRILRVVVFKEEVTLLAFYQTHFPRDGFEAGELPFFALIGVLAGFIGVLFILFYRFVVMFLRQNNWAKNTFQRKWIVYPIVIAFLVATTTYPRGYGRFLTGRFKFSRTLIDLFSNCTWTKPIKSIESPHGCGEEILRSWMNHEGYGPYNPFLVLSLFMITYFFLTALCNTMPIPCGMFMPVFIIGAALGRLVGECVSTIFPDGMAGGTDQPIFPGIYSVVGAAALSASITHSVSVAVICCEITGQYIYIIPLMIAVIIANAISAYLTPSIHDCIITIKHLPFLPDIPPSNAAVHFFCAEHIMASPVKYLPRLTTFKDIKNILVELPKMRSFPVVHDDKSLLLLGSIPRRTLLELLTKQIGDEARQKEAEKRVRNAITTIDMHFNEWQNPPQTPTSMHESRSEESIAVEHEIQPDLTNVRSSPSLNRPNTLAITEGPPKPPRKLLFETPNGNFYRANSDTALSPPHKDSKRKRKTSESLEERPIDPDLKPKRKPRKHRFTIEPVTPVNTPSTEMPPKLTNKKTRSTSPCSRPPPRRRNAFAATVEGQRQNNDSDEGELPAGYLEVPPIATERKGSLPDLIRERLTGDYPASITRNIAEYVKQARKRLNFSKHKANDPKPIYDLFDEERREWEMERLEDAVELDDTKIDPAPFQLVRKTSLYKVHSLFSLLDLNRAYVTERGKLVGVVSLRDLRIAIQQAANGVQPERTNTGEFIDVMTNDTRCDDYVLPLHDLEHGHVKNPPAHLVEHFAAGIERKRQATREPDHDILTPSLKVVHPSAASLQHYTVHPLLTIQEENDYSGRSASSTLERITGSPDSPVARPSILKKSSKNKTIFDQPQASEVAQAVAYLRRKSLAFEEVKTDHTDSDEDKDDRHHDEKV
uniref:Chloride channel protein n=1 Tax=Panagrellus redivivus TaxID=6233 RepID=A0A7E4WAY4_PANRE